MKKEVIIKILGVFLIIFGLLAMIQAISKGEPILIFWICYIGMIIIGIGCLLNKSYLISSQLNIITIPLILWDIDFFSFLMSKSTLFGLADYFFKEPSLISRLVSLEHLFLIPLGILAFYLVRDKKDKKQNNKNSLLISILEVTILFIILRIINISDKNINCAFYFCIPYINPEPYVLWWFVIVFLLIFLTNIIYRFFFCSKNI